MSFTGTIVIDDRQVREALEKITAALPDGIMGRVYSRGAVQRGRRYEHYVMSEARQAWMHQGRWQTDKSIAKEAEPEALEIYRRGMQRTIDTGQNLHKATDDVLDMVYRMATNYPPERPGQTYIRTGILRDSWEKENRL
jgi:hypothetical protein